MKSSIVKTLAFAFAATAILGCQKEVLNSGDLGKRASDPISQGIGIENGALVFESESAMYETLENLSSWTAAERQVFESKHNFKSLGTILDEVNAAEIANEEAFFRGIDPNLTVAQYETMGYYYSPSEIFTEYEEKGVIVAESEADRSRSYHLSIDNPGFAVILNESGIVYAGDKKYLFEASNMKVYDKSSNALLHEVSFGANTESTSNWSQASAWEYDGSTRRFKYLVYGSCITSAPTSNSGLIQSTFYVDALAENKKWGTWASRSSYMPIYSFSGSWTADYRASKDPFTSGPLNPVFLNDNDYTSPFSWHSVSDPYGQTNHFLRYFKPNGSWALNGWYISMPFDVHYTMTYTFAGGPSGFVRTLSH